MKNHVGVNEMMKKQDESRKLLVSKIKNGTVIDHIRAGFALEILNILGITGEEGITVSIAMNVPSNTLGKKDILKIEQRELKKSEWDKIAVIAPNATINLIENYKVVEKTKVELPEEVKGILNCPNPTCISRKEDEHIKSRFKVVSTKPPELRCEFCGTFVKGEELVSQITSR